MADPKTAASAFLTIGRELAETERRLSRLPLGRTELERARRMAQAARENVSEAMTSVGRYLDHARKLGGQS